MQTDVLWIPAASSQENQTKASGPEPPLTVSIVTGRNPSRPELPLLTEPYYRP